MKFILTLLYKILTNVFKICLYLFSSQRKNIFNLVRRGQKGKHT